MARAPRKKSETGIYHVMARGVNRQPIFEEDADYAHMVEALSRCKEKGGFELFAYCLMENHFHLLVRPSDDEPLETIFRRIGGLYVVWFNRKYGRVGHLFQDRFASEAVGSDSYFLSCLRYVVQNPVAAGICESPFDYIWSSALDYAGGRNGITDTGMAVGMLGRAEACRLLEEPCRDRHLDLDVGKRPSDDELRAVMQEVCSCKTTAEFQRLGRAERDAALVAMRRAGGSIRQVARLAGVGVAVARRCRP